MSLTLFALSVARMTSCQVAACTRLSVMAGKTAYTCIEIRIVHRRAIGARLRPLLAQSQRLSLTGTAQLIRKYWRNSRGGQWQNQMDIACRRDAASSRALAYWRQALPLRQS